MRGLIKMNTKIFGAVLFVMLALVSTAMAVDFNTLDVQVEVDNMLLQGGQTVYVEAGSVVPVEVFLTSMPNVRCADAAFRAANPRACESSYRTRVEAFVGGYEFGKIQATSDIFEIEHDNINSVSYRKMLQLQLPSDMQASDDYTLNVEVFDDDQSRSIPFTLRVQEPRHKLSILDVFVSPGTRVVKQGQPMFVSVRVENLGDNREKDIHVIGLVPALGLREEASISELITSVQDDEDEDRFRFDKQTAENTRDLQFFIPEDAKAGEYEFVTRVEYNRGHSVEEKTFKFRVEGVERTETPSVAETPRVPETPRLVVNVDSTAKSVNVGENAVYTFNVANLGQTARVFTLEVLGADFANVRADPQVVTVPKDQTAEAFVALSPKEGFGAGTRNFVVRLVENGKTVSEVALTANVQATSAAPVGTDGVKKALEIGFIVLLVILVVLAIAVIIKKLAESDNGEAEGQTYY